MTQVVQAACPGCKSVLRIPSDWVSQPIRCKNCGTVMQAKLPAGVSAAPVVPAAPPRIPDKTPPPDPAKAKTTGRKHFKTPPPLPPLATPPAPAALQPARVAALASPPTAQPVAAQGFASANTFDFQESVPDESPRGARVAGAGRREAAG